MTAEKVYADGTMMAVTIVPPPVAFPMVIMRAHKTLDRIDTIAHREIRGSGGMCEYVVVTGTPGAGPAPLGQGMRAVAHVRVPHGTEFVTADAVTML